MTNIRCVTRIMLLCLGLAATAARAELDAEQASTLLAQASAGNTDALTEIQTLADQGEARAQLALGWLYYSGTPRNLLQTLHWYRAAASQGNAEAQFSLGRLYLNGEGLPRDPVQAALWFRKAAAQGHPKAQFNLGSMYDQGEGVDPDPDLARLWFRKAAAQGLTLDLVGR